MQNGFTNILEKLCGISTMENVTIREQIEKIFIFHCCDHDFASNNQTQGTI